MGLAIAPVAVQPDVQDVADLIPRLVPDIDGSETGQFSETTNPSFDAVQRLAARSADWVIARFPHLTEAHVPVARDVAALLTAARVARPLDIEEYERLRAELDRELENLRAVVDDAVDGVRDGQAAVAAPQHSFPEVDLGLVAAGAEWPYNRWPYA